MDEMDEVLLYYHLKDEVRIPICTILDQLDVATVEIKDDQVNETMGYLLHIPGFEKSKEPVHKIPTDPLLYFAGMSDEQIELILDVFQGADIPYIPLKSMVTNDNIELPFYMLHENVNKEYQSIKNNKAKDR